MPNTNYYCQEIAITANNTIKAFYFVGRIYQSIYLFERYSIFVTAVSLTLLRVLSNG